MNIIFMMNAVVKRVNRVVIFVTLICLVAVSASAIVEREESSRSGLDERHSNPNIVFVLCDDLGYGDVQCLNPERGKIQTPAVDRLAREGMIFTDAHSGSSVCTPTRYGLLTGRYSWRTWLQRGVVQGFAPCLIAEDRPTVASFLKGEGYHTAIVGKWHLDFQYLDPETGESLKRKGKKVLTPVGSVIPDGPVQRGFDYYHGFHHAREMKVVIENDTVIEHEDEIHMLPRLTRKAVEYIGERAQTDKDRPFFLYVSYGSPHSPIVPTKEWQGKSGLGAHADFVMQTDDGFKQILDALDRNGFAENTLVIFSSDNGTSKNAGIPELESKGHYVSANMRGSKSDLWDGGHRVPFVVRWPGIVNPGSTSDQLICLTDLMATCSDFMNTSLPNGTAEDSVSFLSALKGKPIISTRNGVIHHSISGHFAYRQGKWKLLLAKGSGGWTAPNEEAAAEAGAPVVQLYDLEVDPGETTNLYASHPNVVTQLLAQLEADVSRGRSTDGEAAQNDVAEINLWKSGKN
ncbi:arylsulfatase [Puniceicoccaceae bacterium K14]|nr:arylsulfatase [Puniceicoccaceae bacterium K14]